MQILDDRWNFGAHVGPFNTTIFSPGCLVLPSLKGQRGGRKDQLPILLLVPARLPAGHSHLRGLREISQAPPRNHPYPAIGAPPFIRYSIFFFGWVSSMKGTWQSCLVLPASFFINDWSFPGVVFYGFPENHSCCWRNSPKTGEFRAFSNSKDSRGDFRAILLWHAAQTKGLE